MTQPNACNISPLLSPYFDGELPDDRRAEVEAHLPSCAACRDELRLLGEFSGVIRSLEIPAPPAGRWDHIQAEQRMRIEPKVEQQEPRHLWYIRRLSAAAAIIFLLAAGRIGWVHYNGDGGKTQTDGPEKTVVMPGAQNPGVNRPQTGPTVP